MDDRASRVFAGLCVLVMLWIGVYWLWQPGAPALTYAARGADATQPSPDNQRPSPPPQHGTGQGVVTPTNGGVVAPVFREYAVREGDSFERIALRELGDAALWTVVARANPLKDPRRLRAGQTLRLPLDTGNVQGRVVISAPRPAPAPATIRTPPSTADMATYVVRPGDTLSEISKAHYGSTAEARAIYEANTDTMRDMHSLRVGQTLRLPDLPADDPARD